MNVQAVRNWAIVLALAVVVWLVPGGDTTAGFIGALLSVAFAVLVCVVLARLYREHRYSIFGLGDRMRGTLYGAIAVAVFAMAARAELWSSGGGALLWVALIGGASYALVLVWRHYREYA